jgi:hypothetical protein
MRLRVSIDGAPAFLDIEGPFTVTPIYVSKVKDFEEGVRIPPVPKEVKHASKSKPRFKRHRKTCPVCGKGFLGIPRALYCGDVCRHRAYTAHGGSKKAREWALRIHAGATGVEVTTDDQ